MTEACPHCGGALEPEEGRLPIPAPCPEKIRIETSTEPVAPEIDRRGIELPARSRVGGIIIPQ